MSLRQTLHALPRDARDTLFLLVVIAWVIAPQAFSAYSASTYSYQSGSKSPPTPAISTALP